MILILDFGSQTTHLISRRLGELGVQANIVLPEEAIRKVEKLKPKGIIFSGGPSSVFNKNSPLVDKEIFNVSVPVLGICYGQQLIAHLWGGEVKPGGIKEYGPTEIKVKTSPLFANIPVSAFKVWMSHGDEIKKLPNGFKKIAKTKDIEFAAIENTKRKIYAVQFHPEVFHTEYGIDILENFMRICGLEVTQKVIDIEGIINSIRDKVGDSKVLGAVSGGVDSTVAAALVSKAIGGNFYPIHIENGLMRIGTTEEVINIFKKKFKTHFRIVKAKKIFLKKLKGVSKPERKRKIIGKLYIRLFEKEAKKIKEAKYLLQGTIYSDVIESKGTILADKIKSHHNVGGLPRDLKLQLIEPLREFYKDEVREIGRKLNLPKDIVGKHPFPGPGQAIRIIGEVTKGRLRTQQQADQIVLEEIKRAGWYDEVFQVFPVLTNTKSTAVKGEARFYGEMIAIRCYNSSDIMTTDWTKLPYDLLQRISSRIVNEVPKISRVVYDITTKPPATMEWE